MGIIERILNRLLQHKVIVNCEREPYLHRWYLLRTKRVGIFIHKFVRSDEDRALHDHPWNFIVVPLWRGYVEHSEEQHHCGTFAIQRRVRPLISARFRSAEYRHRVELIDDVPAWSLFIRFTECRTWGFWPNQVFIAWNKWWQNNCE